MSFLISLGSLFLQVHQHREWVDNDWVFIYVWTVSWSSLYYCVHWSGIGIFGEIPKDWTIKDSLSVRHYQYYFHFIPFSLSFFFRLYTVTPLNFWGRYYLWPTIMVMRKTKFPVVHMLAFRWHDPLFGWLILQRNVVSCVRRLLLPVVFSRGRKHVSARSSTKLNCSPPLQYKAGGLNSTLTSAFVLIKESSRYCSFSVLLCFADRVTFAFVSSQQSSQILYWGKRRTTSLTLLNFPQSPDFKYYQ